MSTPATIIPKPVSVVPGRGAFNLTAGTTIRVELSPAELAGLGARLAETVRSATGLALPVAALDGASPDGSIHLTLIGGDWALGPEGYELSVTRDGVRLVAPGPAGIFYGIQTLRQMLPPARQPGAGPLESWSLPAVTIRDYPRFPWRGAMLDVSRHFFGTADVKRYIDLMAAYKLNRLHLHLTDDQGWRIEIKSWPRLAEYGGSTQVGGGPGGYYTQAEYREVVRYARARGIVVVPEIDLPGHTNAALASYPELNAGGVAPALYTGTEVGFSSLCAAKEITYRFLDDVIGEVAGLTPGPYIHIGGDEAASTAGPDYVRLMDRVQAIVEAHGKEAVGWEEIAKAHLRPATVVQFWTSRTEGTELACRAAEQGARIILSPAAKTYLDMKYDAGTRIGYDWAALIEVQAAYDWDPAAIVPGLPEAAILGVESPLWTETVTSFDDIAYMAFPRLAGHAEIGWSPAAGRSWEEYRLRLAAQGPRWEAQGINFYRSPQVPWA